MIQAREEEKAPALAYEEKIAQPEAMLEPQISTLEVEQKALFESSVSKVRELMVDDRYEEADAILGEARSLLANNSDLIA